MLEQNQDKIDWDMLSYNPYALSILEKNQDKIHWPSLCLNPNAISLIEANQDKISWDCLSLNIAFICARSCRNSWNFSLVPCL